MRYRIDADPVSSTWRNPLNQATGATSRRGLPNEASNAAEQAATLRQAAQAFEAILVEQMLHGMRQQDASSSANPSARGASLFQEMLDGEYAQRITQRGGIGIADLLIERWSERGIIPSATSQQRPSQPGSPQPGSSQPSLLQPGSPPPELP